MARLRLPGDPRAVALFRQLEERIDKFARHLPPPLDALASRQSTYLGSPGGEPFEGVAGLNPVLVGTPWLFWETFGRLDDATFITIAEGGACFILASIVLDHLVDGQAEPPETMALFHQALYEHGAARFRAALPSHPAFWQHFERLADEHLAGIAAELDSHTNPSRLDRASFCAMAHGKVAPVVTTIVALSEATHQPDILEPIEILGLDQFANSAVIIKARTKTKPIKQWRVAREFNRRLKKKFDEKNIEIPFPHVTLYMGKDKEGQSPPLNVTMKEKNNNNSDYVDG